jgi:hypothetical protein
MEAHVEDLGRRGAKPGIDHEIKASVRRRAARRQVVDANEREARLGGGTPREVGEPLLHDLRAEAQSVGQAAAPRAFFCLSQEGLVSTWIGRFSRAAVSVS